MNKRREAAALLLAVLLFGAVTWCAAWLLMPVRTQYGSDWEQFLQEDAGSCDVLLFGSSLVYCDVAPAFLWEETGLSAGKWTHLTDIVTTPGFCDEVISIYLAEELTRGETDPDEDEFLNIVKMPLSELTERVMRGEIADSKTIIGALMAQELLKEDGHGV